MSKGYRIPGLRIGRAVVALALLAALAACASEPGATVSTEPSAAPSVAASVAESVAPSSEPVGQFLFLDADTVLGPKNLTDEEKPAKTCVQASRFAHNEQVVWRVKVFDPLTGQQMDDEDLQSVSVSLPGETLDLHYGGHPSSDPLGFFWTTSWVVPEDYPEGIINYTIDAVGADGRTGSWEQFEVGAANLTVTADVRAVIAE